MNEQRGERWQKRHTEEERAQRKLYIWGTHWQFWIVWLYRRNKSNKRLFDTCRRAMGWLTRVVRVWSIQFFEALQTKTNREILELEILAKSNTGLLRPYLLPGLLPSFNQREHDVAIQMVLLSSLDADCYPSSYKDRKIRFWSTGVGCLSLPVLLARQQTTRERATGELQK